jgi:hypothetical protein
VETAVGFRDEVLVGDLDGHHELARRLLRERPRLLDAVLAILDRLDDADAIDTDLTVDQTGQAIAIEARRTGSNRRGTQRDRAASDRRARLVDMTRGNRDVIIEHRHIVRVVARLKTTVGGAERGDRALGDQSELLFGTRHVNHLGLVTGWLIRRFDGLGSRALTSHEAGHEQEVTDVALVHDWPPHSRAMIRGSDDSNQRISLGLVRKVPPSPSE